MDHSPFHQAEQDLQTRYGVRETIEAQGRQMVRAFMPDQHRSFYGSLPFVLVGSVDSAGWPWASVIAGKSGFLSSPTRTSLSVKSSPFTGDPLADHMERGTPVGLLGIDLATRRRNRMNGRFGQYSYEGGSTITVDQEFRTTHPQLQTRT